MAKRTTQRRTSPTDASASALGYLYQCRYALLLALRKDENIPFNVIIEKLDDVAFTRNGSTAAELLQFKHVLRRSGNLGDKSPDIWKTLKIWSEKAKKRSFDLSTVSLNFVTTSTATDQNAIRFLRPANSERDPEKSLVELLKAGAASKNTTVTDGHTALIALTDRAQHRLFEAITLLEGSPDILGVRTKLENELRVVRRQHRKGFIDRLEGWWFRVVIEQLMDADKLPLSTETLWETIYDLQGQFQRDSLPVDMLDAIVPETDTPEQDERVFVRQLQLIGVSQDRTRMAQEDFYRAYQQRSRWIRDNLIELDEFDRFNDRLIDGWKQKFEIIRESVESHYSEERLKAAGRKIYDWTQVDATTDHNLVIRPQVQGAYIIRGSYHMLSDRQRVGWHPRYPEWLESEDAYRNGENDDVDSMA